MTVLTNDKTASSAIGAELNQVFNLLLGKRMVVFTL